MPIITLVCIGLQPHGSVVVLPQASIMGIEKAAATVAEQNLLCTLWECCCALLSEMQEISGNGIPQFNAFMAQRQLRILPPEQLHDTAKANKCMTQQMARVLDSNSYDHVLTKSHSQGQSDPCPLLPQDKKTTWKDCHG